MKAFCENRRIFLRSPFSTKPERSRADCHAEKSDRKLHQTKSVTEPDLVRRQSRRQKTVLIKTLICTADVPKIAGAIKRITCRTPSSVKLKIGVKRKPTLKSEGNCIKNCAAPPINVPIAIPIIAHCVAADGKHLCPDEPSQPPPESQ